MTSLPKTMKALRWVVPYLLHISVLFLPTRNRSDGQLLIKLVGSYDKPLSYAVVEVPLPVIRDNDVLVGVLVMLE